MGLEKRRPFSSACTAKNLGNSNKVPRRGSAADQRADTTKICGITFEAFAVEHSILAPAVGYRISAGHACIFYVPDLIFIHDRAAALQNVQIYIGDGATVTRSFIRRRGKILIGHSPVRTQLTWCEKEGVSQAIITHCGSEIVTGDERKLCAQLRALAADRGIEVRIADDGMKLKL
jgi:hypothetical protein